jgi:hypothetical protein
MIRTYYRNTLTAAGVPDADPGAMDKAQLVSVASGLFRWLVTTIIGGKEERLEAAAKQAAAFRARLGVFAGRDELRSIQAWLGRFGQDLGSEIPALRAVERDVGEPAEAWAREFSQAQLLTLALGVSRHAGLGLTRAAVFVKLLCEDVGYFSDYSVAGRRQALFVPADHTNLRMARYFLARDPVFAMIYPEDILRRMRAHPRSDESFFRLSLLAHELLERNAVHFERLWFVGRYYHDSTKKPDRKRRGDKKKPATPRAAPRRVCTVNQDLVTGEAQLFADVHEPTACPFRAAGCLYRKIDAKSRGPKKPSSRGAPSASARSPRARPTRR